jgi:putative transposase
MFTLLSAILSGLSCRFRGRSFLELEVVALRHQVAVLRRQHPGRPRIGPWDRLLWAWLYKLWPQCLEVMVLVKPATVIQWHRAGFRLYWRWRSRTCRLGRPRVDCQVRNLIRQMSEANPLWGAPRIHGELLKLGIHIGQTAVAKYTARPPHPPSPSWRTFLKQHVEAIAAIDMFIVVSATFQRLCCIIPA